MTLAVSRLYLDNVPHIQASWVTQGLKMGQVALRFGADDLGSTMIEENVVAATGLQVQANRDDLVHAIRGAGFTPAQRRTDYTVVKTFRRRRFTMSLRRTWLPWLAVALMVAAALLATGCGGGQVSTTTSPTAKPTKIAIIAPEKANDFGWNQQGVESAKAIAKELGAEIEVSDGAGYGDIAPIYRQLVANKADWIILWASGYNTVGPQLAEETNTKTVVIGGFENGLVPGLCADFETNAQEGAYLAGVVAALMSRIGYRGHRTFGRRRELEQDGRRLYRWRHGRLDPTSRSS